MLIFLDTNILQEDFLLRSGRFGVLLAFAQKTASRFVLPQIVYDELLANYGRVLEERFKALIRATEQVNGVLPTHLLVPEAPSIPQAVEEYQRRLLALLGVTRDGVRPYNPALLPEVMARSIQRRPPCTEKGEEIRDALLWCSILDIASKESGRVCFVSHNTREFTLNKKDLHPELAAEAERLGIAVEYFPSLEDFARKHATPISFVTLEWIEDQVSADAVADEIYDLLMEEAREAAFEREGRYSTIEGHFRIRRGGLSAEDFFVNRVDENSLRVEVTWFGTFEIGYEVRENYDFHGSGFLGRGEPGPLSERSVELSASVTLQLVVEDQKVAMWSFIDGDIRR